MIEADKLVKALIEGDEAAWHEYMRAYGKLILIVAGRFGLRAADRDEVYQETCLQAYRSIGTLRDPSKLSSWTYSIAYRMAIKLITRRPRELSAEDLGGSFLVDGLQDDAPSPEDITLQFEEAQILRSALGELDVSCRNLLTLLYLNEPRPSYEDISRELRMPMGSIGPTRARCLVKLKKILRSVSGATSAGTTQQSKGTGPARGTSPKGGKKR